MAVLSSYLVVTYFYQAMAFEKYDDEKLLKTAKSLKIVLLALCIVWALLIAFFIGTQIYAIENDQFSFANSVPFFAGIITMLPVYVSYKNCKNELKKRGLS